MEGCARQLFVLKALLNSFADSTGLKVNFSKSMLIPINISEDKVNHLARTFGCVVGSWPFTYLGLPLGLTKPRVDDFLPLINRCERRLTSTSLFLSQAGKLQMVNSVFSSLPTFFMSTFLLHSSVREQVDKFRKHCLWRGSDDNSRINAKAAWSLVARTKQNGGLGVLDLRTQNEALLLKQLHKFFNRADIPWVHLVWEKHYNNGKLPGHTKKGSFWWWDVLKLLDKFKGMATPQINDGATCLFWDDCWAGQPLKQTFPELFSFAKKAEISLKNTLAESQFYRLFNLPLSIQAFDQLQELQELLHSLNPSSNLDVWRYIWGDSTFSPKQAYNQLMGTNEVHPIFSWIWKSSCQPKHKVFFWLVLLDRVSTRNLLRRKQMFLPSYNCALCNDDMEEYVDHLFLDCRIARDCWALIGLSVTSSPDMVQKFENLRNQIGKRFFMEIIIIMCWSIWTIRNDAVFREIPACSLWCLEIFRSTFKQLLWRAKKKYFPAIELWLEQAVF